MNRTVEERVRARAHAIWMEEGCPDGRAEAHWARAEQEIGGRLPARRKAPVKAATPAPQTTARKPRARKAAVTV